MKGIDKKLLNNENTYDKQLLDEEDDDDEEEEEESFMNNSNSMFCDTNDLLSNTMPVSLKDKQVNIKVKFLIIHIFNQFMHFPGQLDV